MAWINVLDGDQASDKVQNIYKKLVNPQTGTIDNIMKVHSLHPEGLEAHYKLYRAVMASTKTLRRIDREMIAVVVSDINGCEY